MSQVLTKLLEQQEQLDLAIEAEKKRDCALKKQLDIEDSIKVFNSITPEIAEWLLAHIEHDRSSCSVYKNGFNNYGYACKKCALEEYLTDSDLASKYKLQVDVFFTKI